MIVFNGTEAIEIISLSRIKEELDNHLMIKNELPFIQFQYVDEDNLECLLGYVDVNGKYRYKDEIIIGHVAINWIEVKRRKYDENTRNKDEYYVEDYSICICFTDNQTNRYDFYSSYNYVINKRDGQVKTKQNDPLVYFFTIIVPMINEAIDSGIETSQLNMEYYYKQYSDCGKKYASYERNPYSIDLEDVLNLVYSLHVDIVNDPYGNDDVTCYATFEGKEGVIYNLYIAKLISAIIHAHIWKQSNNNRIEYKGRCYDIPTYLKYDEESFRRYLLRKLYVGILLNYEQDKAEEGFRHAEWIRDYKDIEQDDTIRSILNFILGIKATCFKDGENRVGRDDKGWTEYTVLFPMEFGFKPSHFLLNLINETLGVKLERQNENLCYYHRYKTEPEYIVGMAWRQDFGSSRLQRNYLHRLLKKIVPMLVSNDDVNKMLFS